MTRGDGWQNIVEPSLGIKWKMVLELDKQTLTETAKKCLNPVWKDGLHIWGIFKLQFDQNVDCRTYPIWGTFFMKNKNLIIKSAYGNNIFTILAKF